MSQDKSPIRKDAQNSDAPEGKNRSQRDENTQAKTVGKQAQNKNREAASDHDPSDDAGAINPQDKQDLVDHMKQMERSGVIDNSAYRGERNDADSESPLGRLGPDNDRDPKLSDE